MDNQNKNARKGRIQTQRVTFNTGVTAGTYETTLQLDTTYKRCVGMWLEELTDGDQAFVNVGISDNDGVIMDLSHWDLLQADAGVSPNDKFFNHVPFVVYDGQGLKIRTQIPGTVATDAVDFILHFLLARDEETRS